MSTVVAPRNWSASEDDDHVWSVRRCMGDMFMWWLVWRCRHMVSVRCGLNQWCLWSSGAEIFLMSSSRINVRCSSVYGGTSFGDEDREVIFAMPRSRWQVATLTTKTLL